MTVTMDGVKDCDTVFGFQIEDDICRIFAFVWQKMIVISSSFILVIKG